MYFAYQHGKNLKRLVHISVLVSVCENWHSHFYLVGCVLITSMKAIGNVHEIDKRTCSMTRQFPSRDIFYRFVLFGAEIWGTGNRGRGEMSFHLYLLLNTLNFVYCSLLLLNKMEFLSYVLIRGVMFIYSPLQLKPK